MYIGRILTNVGNADLFLTLGCIKYLENSMFSRALKSSSLKTLKRIRNVLPEVRSHFSPTSQNSVERFGLYLSMSSHLANWCSFAKNGGFEKEWLQILDMTMHPKCNYRTWNHFFELLMTITGLQVALLADPWKGGKAWKPWKMHGLQAHAMIPKFIQLQPTCCEAVLWWMLIISASLVSFSLLALVNGGMKFWTYLLKCVWPFTMCIALPCRW
jgi:hypothetical protein